MNTARKGEGGPEIRRAFMTSTELRQLRNAAMAVAIVFSAIAAVGAGWAATLAYAVWGMFVAGIHALYFELQALEVASRAERELEDDDAKKKKRGPSHAAFRTVGQLLMLGVGVVATGWLIFRAWSLPMGEATPSSLRLGVVMSIAAGVLLSLLGRYATVLGSKLETRVLDGVAHLARFSFWIGALIAACMATLLYAEQDYRLLTGRIIVVVTAVLVFDAALRAMLRAYRPAQARSQSGPVGDSLLLALIQRGSNPWEELSTRVESALGVKLGGTWAFRFARNAFLPLVLTVAFLAWVSTTATVVPVGHEGVRVEMGKFVEPAVGPGWHWTKPWPFASIEVVPTKRVDEVLLGFERDTGHPILWTEKHYEGEKNLLVGDGDELLTISVPVQFRIRDPLAYLRSTADARTAVTHLAYRELLRVSSARDSFAVMTDLRAEIAADLHRGLQRAVDARGLGLEIVWVGLRDVHPPVDVTPVYQDVISAEEERETVIERARAYAALTLPSAEQEAERIRSHARATGAERRLMAAGEAARFRALAEAQKENPGVFRTRLRLQTLEEALMEKPKLVVATAEPPEITMDSRRDKKGGN